MCPPQYDGYDFFEALEFGDLKFQTYLAPLDFIRSHGSGDMWLSADQCMSSSWMIGWSKFSLSLWASGVSNLN
jgi:hypothetical protein